MHRFSCTVSRSKKRPFHTISTNFNKNLTPNSQKTKKITQFANH